MTTPDISRDEMWQIACDEAERLVDDKGNVDIYALIRAIGERLPKSFVMFPLNFITGAKEAIEASRRLH